MAQIIGIGGVSRSGKSTLARKLSAHFSDKRVCIFDQDDFVKPEAEIPKVQDRTDWEHPASIDVDALVSEIYAAQAHHDLIIVEGLLAFHFDELTRLYDLTIFMQIDFEMFLFRRQKETRWGAEPDWYIRHVWEAHLPYGQFPAADFVLTGENEISPKTFTELIKAISI